MPKSTIAGSSSNSVNKLKRNCSSILQSRCTIIHFNKNCRRDPVSLNPTGFGVATLFCFSCSDRHVIISQFPSDYCLWVSFHNLICHLWIISGEMLVYVFCPFPNGIVCLLVLDFEKSIYIAGISILSCMWLTKFFSQSAIYLFILSIRIFRKGTKIFTLIYFPFMDHSFDVRPKNSLPSLGPKDFVLFFPKIYLVLHLNL